MTVLRPFRLFRSTDMAASLNMPYSPRNNRQKSSDSEQARNP